MDQRKPYSGDTRSLVVALDVGTTFSGVSYAILEPREVPKIHGVTRFPGQEHIAGNSKIPSILYYDRHGKIMAAGAEAHSMEMQAEDEGWVKAELFKLRLRPRSMRLQMNGMSFPPLPYKKTAVDVFGDFLGYLFKCTRNFIIDTHANGKMLWRNVEHDIQFVLSHPNGWEGAQQTKMRRAAIYGGLIPDTNEGKARIRFVTEGEASLHACVLNGLAADVLSNPSRPGFVVADAGGGTLDISSYAIKGTTPLVIEEIAPPDCIFAGSVFVSRRAREFLEGKLKNSRYGAPDSLDHIEKKFDETTKRLFRDRKDVQFIPFGSPLDKDTAVGIRGGQLKLTGAEVAELFEPSVEAATSAIMAQIESSHGLIKSVWLVGGFAASPWLFSQLQERLAPLDVTVSRPDSQTSKAVADGAIGFWCDHHVNARMSKFYYGVEYLREFNPNDPEHLARKDRLCELPSGPKLLPDAFDCILARNVKVKESTVFTRKYCTELTNLSMLSVFEVEIWCYRGGDTIPPWILRQQENFSTLCVVRANLSPLSGSAQPKESKNGHTYWTIVFSVEIHFGLTEFKARIKWVDSHGKTKYGPASIVYNERGHRADESEPDILPEDDDLTVPPQSRPPRNRSEPASRARSREVSPSRHVPPVSSSRTPSTSIPSEPYAQSAVPDVYRERSTTNGSSRAPTAAPASPAISRLGSRYGSESEREKDRLKGKERQRSERSERSGHNPDTSHNLSRSIVDTPSATNRGGLGTPKLAEALTDTWGAHATSSPGRASAGQSRSSPTTNHEPPAPHSPHADQGRKSKDVTPRVSRNPSKVEFGGVTHIDELPPAEPVVSTPPPVIPEAEPLAPTPPIAASPHLHPQPEVVATPAIETLPVIPETIEPPPKEEPPSLAEPSPVVTPATPKVTTVGKKKKAKKGTLLANFGGNDAETSADAGEDKSKSLGPSPGQTPIEPTPPETNLSGWGNLDAMDPVVVDQPASEAPQVEAMTNKEPESTKLDDLFSFNNSGFDDNSTSAFPTSGNDFAADPNRLSETRATSPFSGSIWGGGGGGGGGGEESQNPASFGSFGSTIGKSLGGWGSSLGFGSASKVASPTTEQPPVPSFTAEEPKPDEAPAPPPAEVASEEPTLAAVTEGANVENADTVPPADAPVTEAVVEPAPATPGIGDLEPETPATEGEGGGTTTAAEEKGVKKGAKKEEPAPVGGGAGGKKKKKKK